MRLALQYLFGILLCMSGHIFASNPSINALTLVYEGITVRAVSMNDDASVNVHVYGADGESFKAMQACDKFENIHNRVVKKNYIIP
jgi:hypothetical protein